MKLGEGEAPCSISHLVFRASSTYSETILLSMGTLGVSSSLGLPEKGGSCWQGEQLS